MDSTTKALKIIRIVSLTLGIICMVLFLWNKIAHAENTSVPYPAGAPYMPSWDYSPFKDNAEAQANLVAGVQQALADKGFNNNPEFMITMLSFNSTNQTYNCRVYFNAGRNGNMFEYGTYLMQGWLNDESSRFGFSACYGEIDCTTNGQVYRNGLPTAPNVNSFNNGYTSDRSGVALQLGTCNGRNVVVYSSAQVHDITGNDMNVDTGYITIEENTTGGNGELDEAVVTEALELAEVVINGGVQATDSIEDAKIGTIQGFFQSVVNAIWNNGKNLIDNLKTFFTPMFNVIKQIWSLLGQILEKLEELLTWLQGADIEDPDTTLTSVWTACYQASWVYSLVQIFTSLKTQIGSIGNTPTVAPVLTITVPDNALMRGFTRVVNFNWYLDVKDTVIPIITAFATAGFGVYLFTQFPNVIHGVSGTGSRAEHGKMFETGGKHR